ncbi:hypothetical protein [Vulgatibacter sp.]|uniref:hypothetical protein n=1 Tax=Vulgatibacter sp. TaxID=1971226 RepID=UPI00356A28CD
MHLQQRKLVLDRIGSRGSRGDLRERVAAAASRLEEALEGLRAKGDGREQLLLLTFAAVADALLDNGAGAGRSLEEARASLGVLDDPAAAESAALLEGILELAQARLHVQALRQAQQGAGSCRNPRRASALEERARLRSPSGATAAGVGTLRLLDASAWREPGAAAEAGAALRIGPDGNFFELPGGARADLRRRGAMRRIFLALVEQRLLAPGEGLSQQALADLGWPGEAILPDAAASRVYTSIRTLRAMGLGGILRKHADGYLLDPDVAVARAGW